MPDPADFATTQAEPLEVRVPYRLSPLGAHTDHQMGLSTGLLLEEGLVLEARVLRQPRLILESRDFDGRVDIDLSTAGEGGPSALSLGHWGDYALGIARELSRRQPLRFGIEGTIRGALSPGGIGSSAALQISVLVGLCRANSITLDPAASVELVVAAERGSCGAEVGSLDPAVILYGRPGALVFLDFRAKAPRLHRFPRSCPDFELALFDAGETRELCQTPYNERIEACRRVARALGAPGEEPHLRDVPPELFRRRRADLDPVDALRAEHVFAENKRVRLGLDAIGRGDLESFGRLMSASGESLARNFGVGTPPTDALLRVLRKAPGVMGVSYAGAGFGSHLQAIIVPGSLDAIVTWTQEAGAAPGPGGWAKRVALGGQIEVRRG